MKKDKNLNLDFFQIARLNYSTSRIIMGGNDARDGGCYGTITPPATGTGDPASKTVPVTIENNSTFRCNPEDGD